METDQNRIGLISLGPLGDIRRRRAVSPWGCCHRHRQASGRRRTQSTLRGRHERGGRDRSAIKGEVSSTEPACSRLSCASSGWHLLKNAALRQQNEAWPKRWLFSTARLHGLSLMTWCSPSSGWRLLAERVLPTLDESGTHTDALLWRLDRDTAVRIGNGRAVLAAGRDDLHG